INLDDASQTLSGEQHGQWTKAILTIIQGPKLKQFLFDFANCREFILSPTRIQPLERFSTKCADCRFSEV
ncbi:MAG: hypothetical protein MUQ84_03865, partial [Loktanella sp.]|nr:hypothetical protein [Loktanella sp.]